MICFYIPKSRKYIEHFQFIPYKFLGLRDNESAYPLSYALAPIGEDMAIGDFDADWANQYYLKYCGDDLREKLEMVETMLGGNNWE